jgi:hypothetical protein
MVPRLDGAYFSDRQKEALWDRSSKATRSSLSNLKVNGNLAIQTCYAQLKMTSILRFDVTHSPRLSMMSFALGNHGKPIFRNYRDEGVVSLNQRKFHRIQDRPTTGCNRGLFSSLCLPTVISSLSAIFVDHPPLTHKTVRNRSWKRCLDLLATAEIRFDDGWDSCCTWFSRSKPGSLFRLR